MTENEAVKELKEAIDCCTSGEEDYFKEALGMGIVAITEIQQYRAIGTVEEFKAFKLGRLCNKGFITIGQTIEEFKEEIRNKAIDEFVEVLKEKNKTFIIGNRMIEDIAERLKGVQE